MFTLPTALLPATCLPATLAQSSVADTAMQDSVNWLTQDPTGRIVGLAGAAVIGLIALVIFFKLFKWAAVRWKMLTGVALLLGMVFLASIYLFNMGLTGWLIGGGIVFGCFIAAALFLSGGGKR